MKKRSSHRTKTPSEFISRIYHWRVLKNYKDTHTPSEWKALLAVEKVPDSTANKRIRVASCLLPDLKLDGEYLRNIANLRIPQDTLIKACSDNVTKEQRDRFFSLFSEDEMVLQEEAEKRLEQVLRPSVKPFTETEKYLLSSILEQMKELGSHIRVLLSWNGDVA